MEVEINRTCYLNMAMDVASWIIQRLSELGFTFTFKCDRLARLIWEYLGIWPVRRMLSSERGKPVLQRTREGIGSVC